MPLGACAALLLFPDDYSNYSWAGFFWTALIVAGSLFLVSWVTVLGPVYESSGDDDRLELIVSLACPIRTW